MDSSSTDSSSDFSPAEVFAGALMQQINKTDVVNMVAVQRDMLSRFEKTNEMLINFNILSANRYAIVSQDFKKHTALIYDMKKDLDTIFKRIRVLKQRLGTMYPDAFHATSMPHRPMTEDDTTSLSSASSMDVPVHVHGPTNPAKSSMEPISVSLDSRGASPSSNVLLPGVSSRDPSFPGQGASKSDTDLRDIHPSTRGSMHQ